MEQLLMYWQQHGVRIAWSAFLLALALGPLLYLTGVSLVNAYRRTQNEQRSRTIDQ